MSRDLEFERSVLERVEQISAQATRTAADFSGRTVFADHALTRLAAGEREYGNQWRQLGARRLVAEMLEEAADLGGWGVLALQSIDPEDVSGEVIGVIMTAITMAAGVHEMLERAHSMLGNQDEGEA